MLNKEVLNIWHVHNTAGGLKIMRTSLHTEGEKMGILSLNCHFAQTTAEIRKVNHEFLYKIANAF